MRNLKRALSLTLASVMLLGMMVVGTSAASYPDVTEEHNVEAIEVLQAVGVMSGSDSGNFNPDSQVSRIEMAVVMSNLLNLKVDYFENQCRFTDVPAWAGKYVAACEASGIVSGIGNNQFGVGNVTATQAALMMLKALGYFQYASDFAGGWEQETAKLTANLGLFKGLSNVYNTTELTRNQVAQLALNTLKTPVVVADDNTLHITTTVGGADTTVTSGKVTYKVTASQDSFARAISPVEGSDQTTVSGMQGSVIELGEKLYDGKLQLHENARVNDIGAVYDEFGRPARRWQYDGTTFGTYPKKEDIRKEYTTEVTGRELYDLLGSDILNSVRNGGAGAWRLNVTIDGETTKTVLGDAYFSEASIIRTNTDGVGKTDNGTLTQVYVDSVNHRVDIAIINTYLAIAEQDYNSRDNDVDLKVYRISDDTHNNIYVKTERDADKTEIITAGGEDFAITEVKDGDKFLVTVAQGEIQSMTAPEVVSETTLNSFKKNDWVKNDDAQYDYAATAQYDAEVLDEYDQTNMKDVTYNVILDQYGYLIGLELNEQVNNYLFLTGLDLGQSNLSTKNASANVIFLDGTMSTVTVKVDKSQKAEEKEITDSDGVKHKYTITGGVDDISNIVANADMSQINTWCTYSVDSDGVYTLRVVGNNSKARDDGFKGAKKIAQSVMNVASGQMGVTPATVNQLDISSKSVALDGSRFIHDETNTGIHTNYRGDFKFVYGNADTVYINAALKAVQSKDGGLRAIVDKVDSVATGVANVDMTVKNITASGKLLGATVPLNEVYVLYKDNGYVIGAVVLNAEDNGTTSNWAYITGDVNEEDFLGSSQWKWYRNAIINGKKVRLTEIDDGMDVLANANMSTGSWYSLRFDKDGNVTGVKEETPGYKYIKFDAAPYDKFIDNVNDVYNSANGVGSFNKESSALLYADFTCSGVVSGHNGPGARELKFENGTLYTNRGQSEGFDVMSDVKVVLITSKGHNEKIWDNIDDQYEGWSGLDAALKALDSETSGGYSAFDGILTAVFKDGRATSIILHDQSGNGKRNPEENGKPMVITVKRVGTDGSTFTDQVISWNGRGDLKNLVSVPNGYELKTAPTVQYTEGATGVEVTFTYQPARADKYPGTFIEAVLNTTGTNGNTKAGAYQVSRINYTGEVPNLDHVVDAVIEAAEKAGLVFTGYSEANTGSPSAGTLYEFKRGNQSKWIEILDNVVANSAKPQGTVSGNANSDQVDKAITDAGTTGKVVVAEGATATLTDAQVTALNGVDGGLEVAEGATVTLSGTTNVTKDVNAKGTVNVNGAATVTEIKGNGTVNVNAAATVTTVSQGATVNLNTAGASVGTVSAASKVNVKADATLGSVAVGATVSVAKDTTATITGTTLPKITGEGTVKFTGDIGGETMTSLAQKLGDVKSETAAGATAEVSIARNSVKIDKTSTGKLTAFSSRPLNEEINPKNTVASLYTIVLKSLPACTVTANATYKDNTTGGTFNSATLAESGDETFVLLLGDQVAKVTFTVTPTGDDAPAPYTIVYTING